MFNHQVSKLSQQAENRWLWWGLGMPAGLLLLAIAINSLVQFGEQVRVLIWPILGCLYLWTPVAIGWGGSVLWHRRSAWRASDWWIAVLVLINVAVLIGIPLMSLTEADRVA